MSKHPIYKAALLLYPKSFRKHYGAEMVAVLDDLLAEESGFWGRCLVWIRVSSELPFSIAQENSNNLGGKIMNSMVTKKNQRIIAGVVVVSLLLVGILSATVLKDRITLQYVNYVKGKTMKQELAKQSQLIGDPVNLLAGKTVPRTNMCNLTPAPGISSQIFCTAATTQYVKTSEMGSQSGVLANVEIIESKLKEQGYDGGTNGVTLKSLIAGTYEGKDYSPDATYSKTIGDYTCNFSTTVAYSNPAPAAINTSMTCFRTFNL